MTARSAASQARLVPAARLVGALGLLALLAALLPRATAGYPIDPNWAPPRTVYVPETGQTVDGLFLDLWREWGGALSWGYPITPEITEDDGHIVQYYDYARFEYWPEGDQDGNYVTLGAIGVELRPYIVPRSVTKLDARPTKADIAAQRAAVEIRAWMPLHAEEAEAAAVREPSYRYVPETEHGVWGGFRAFWEATGEAAYLGNPLTEEYVAGETSYQVFERGKLAWEEGTDVRMEPIGSFLTDRYGFDRSPVAQGDVPTYDEALFVPPRAVPDPSLSPGPVPGAAKSIVVSLGEQALWAYENGTVVESTYVSTGKERFRTPSGMFFVNSKLPEQDMAGVIGGESYNVPKVPDVMYFTDLGHALHGTYWHDNFGTPMSHGCINLPLDVSQWLYDWAPVGTPVLIVQ